MSWLDKMPKIAVIATLGGMLFGFDISSISAVDVSKQYLSYFNAPAGVIQGAIGSSLAAGSVVGSICAGYFSDRFGRRDSVWYANWFWLIGTAVQVSSRSVGQLIAGRAINGLCIGVTTSQVPVYLAEIAKAESRGTVVIIQQLACEFGILIMYFLSYGCSVSMNQVAYENEEADICVLQFISGPASFRVAWAMQWIPSVLMFFLLPFLPESPRWFAKVGRKKEAIEVLARIQANGDVNDPLVIAEWEEISITNQAENDAGNIIQKLFFRGMWKRTLAGFTVQMWQQLSGANVMVYYLTYIAEMAGLTGNVAMITSGIQYAVFIIFTGITFLFVDKVGRRSLLISGALSMGLCHFIVGAIMATNKANVPGGIGGNPNVNFRVVGKNAQNAVITFSYLLIVAYSITLAPMCWIYAAEVWSLGTRATGMGIASLGNWLFNFALGLFTPPGFQNIQWEVFMIFGTLCIFMAGWVFGLYPETCGKTLEEIEFMFSKDGPPAWKTRKGDSRLAREIEDVKARKQAEEAPSAEGVQNEKA
ncbi:hypothetical protein N7474_000138 [Penicillium riverlandense]|uniref:uncharacterized protein n=1 Tax=Penicillium riverlandense TaxID=1903569 RepID=UPI002549A75F|nr:uncharacterized protein N7474_000138 [Penicillium riverlandense]KAJ5831827.1 hypothetical protein N7474_000138 [Penicillium riverlandense]